jgi:hypothetical protein
MAEISLDKYDEIAERREMRAALERHTQEQIIALKHELEELKKEMSAVIEWKARHTEQYLQDAPTLSVLRHVAGFSVVMRWLVIGLLGLLSAIGALQLAIETIQKWVVK